MGFIFLLIGFICYAAFFYSFLALIAFIGNLANEFTWLAPILPFRIDSIPSVFSMQSLLINCGLIVLFGIQHSVMAREFFKKRLTKLLPQPLERSLYVLASSIVLLVLMIFWQPMTVSLWQVENYVGTIILWCSYALGWFLVFFSSFIINHFDLFGLRQVYFPFINKPYEDLPFQIKSLYKLIRHPLYLGILLGVWSTPSMSIGHLVLAVGFSVYIFIGMHFEEQDMIRIFGEKYIQYKNKTAMIIPFFKKK
jgi:methanethiol S-methyltransferase